ncbi:hypothetical protein GYH30_052553 [Glycine max]|nr:hypothetical protein GYH30_052553 [Glycine max]
MGYCFYCWFARGKGSGARKGKILKNKKGKKFCDKLFCHRKEKREDRGLTNEKHKRYIRRKTRCGCRTECRVHIGINSRLRYVSYIHNGHSHELLNDEECRMLPKNRLRHLFWCDWIIQVDYSVFGDVLAFDATYGKNKYDLLVILFGVNHHNHRTVFGVLVVANKIEETYVRLLE